MDFAIFPPEVNSGRMYIGAGSESMVAAAEAWEALASELHTTANAYQSVISGLTAGPWLGPSSASMAAAAAAYVSWLNSAAAGAEEAAIQSRAAVAAYEEAFASTVPPQLVAANRSLLARLVAADLFGQYTSAIAATEAQYAEMWAQDTAAMYRYAAASAAATTLTPFASPRQNTDPTGSVKQAAAAGQAAGTSVGNVQNDVSSAQQTFSAVPRALQSFAIAAPLDPPTTSSLTTLSNLITIFVDLPASLVGTFVGVPLGVLGLVALPFDIGGYGTGLHTDDIVSGWNGEQPWPGTGPAPVKEFPAPLLNLPPGTVPPPRVSAGVGQANTVGTLSVPATWTIATPMVRPVSYALPALPAATAGAVEEVGSGTTFGQMALAGLAGRAIAGTLGTGAGKDGGKSPGGEQLRAAAGEANAAQAPAADGEAGAPESTPRTVVTGVAAELREFAKLRDEGILTEEEYTEQKNRLLGR
ncbi:PPE domain-containing protein [Mycobacterium europaeum]|uniref:PPE family protein, SVP subgroup n=1 Tax=Mycobacterium europaeum TaxID=761804 RepID=UPI002ADFC40B|nr:PPE domain-containing protein [Mycobacterium europaeum]MEA1162648.1 PPE domain-containing protein [Mycobacterium europaeum]